MKSKYIIVVPDGMADHPIEILGKKTPLEVSHHPNLNYLANHGITGLVKTIPDGFPPGSDIGNLSIMGYNPKEHFSGRAPLEAANQNIFLKDDEVAFRCNLVTLQDDTMADYSAGHISTQEATILIEAINKAFKSDHIKFYPGKSYRHTMVVKSDKVSQLLKIKCTPPHDILEKKIESYWPQGKESNFLIDLMMKSRDVLLDHSINKVRVDLKENPATMIWLWGQGNRPNLPSFQSRYGIKGAMISAVDLVNGIGRLAGLEIVSVPGITGYYDTNYLAKAEYAINALKKNDFVYIHIEAPDEAGHNGDIKNKIAAIERIDQDIIGTILKHYNLKDDFRLLVLPDHPTPVELRCHVDDPVCFVMMGKGIASDGSTQYDEASSMKRGIKFNSGEQLMDYFLRKDLD